MVFLRPYGTNQPCAQFQLLFFGNRHAKYTQYASANCSGNLAHKAQGGIDTPGQPCKATLMFAG